MSVLDKDLKACLIYDYFEPGMFQYQVSKVDKVVGSEANYLKDVYEHQEDRYVSLDLNNVELERLDEELFNAMIYIIGRDDILITEIPQYFKSDSPRTVRKWIVQCPLGSIDGHPVTSGIITLPIRHDK